MRDDPREAAGGITFLIVLFYHDAAAELVPNVGGVFAMSGESGS